MSKLTRTISNDQLVNRYIEVLNRNIAEELKKIEEKHKVQIGLEIAEFVKKISSEFYIQENMFKISDDMKVTITLPMPMAK